MEEREVRDENRRIRFLRFLVDLSILSIQQSDLSVEEALQVVEDVKKAVLSLFPGKGDARQVGRRRRRT